MSEPPKKVPGSVILAQTLLSTLVGWHFLILSILLITSLFGGGLGGMALLIIGLSVGFILFGIMLMTSMRNPTRPPWQLARATGIIGAVLFFGMTGIAVTRMIQDQGQVQQVVIFLAVGLGYLGITLALWRPSAIEFYGLVCSECGTRCSRPTDLFLKRVWCNKCKRAW